jgi:hypothetical protein
MRFAAALTGYEDLTRRLAVLAAERADALFARRGMRRVATEAADTWSLGAEAWPGALLAGRAGLPR